MGENICINCRGHKNHQDIQRRKGQNMPWQQSWHPGYAGESTDVRGVDPGQFYQTTRLGQWPNVTHLPHHSHIQHTHTHNTIRINSLSRITGMTVDYHSSEQNVMLAIARGLLLCNTPVFRL